MLLPRGLLYRAPGLTVPLPVVVEPPGPWTPSFNLPVTTRHWWLGSEVASTEPGTSSGSVFQRLTPTHLVDSRLRSSMYQRESLQAPLLQPRLHHSVNLS